MKEDHSQNPWTKKNGKVIYDNPWITVEEDEVRNPGGSDSIYGKVLFKNYAIGIIPVDAHLNTWLVGQWRYTLNEYSWEIPMGGGPKSDSMLDSAKRELKEETGIIAKKWTAIQQIHTSNSVTDEFGKVFLAEDLSFGKPEFEETEKLEIRKLTLLEAVEWCESGKITDGISVSGLLRLARMKGI